MQEWDIDGNCQKPRHHCPIPDARMGHRWKLSKTPASLSYPTSKSAVMNFYDFK
jgi:hypothetical protein